MTEFAGIQSVLVLFMCFLQSSPVYLVNIMHTWNINLCHFSSWNHVTFDYKKLITACCFNLCSWHMVTRLLTLDVLYKIFTITYKISILNFIQRLEDPLPPIGYLMHLVGVDVLTLPPCQHWVWSSRFAYNNFTATDVIFNASSCVLPNVLNSQRVFNEILAVQLHSL